MNASGNNAVRHWLDAPISTAALVTIVDKLKTTTVRAELEAVRSEVREAVKNVRAAYWMTEIETGDAKAAKKKAAEVKKAECAYITPSGTFSRRQDDALDAHTGVVMFDLDDLADVKGTKARLEACPNVGTVFLTVTETGLRVFVPVTPIPTNAAEHRAAYRAALPVIEAAAGLKVNDNAGEDVSRASFISSDPTIHINADAVPVTWHLEPQKKVAEKVGAGSLALSTGTKGDKPDKATIVSALASIPPHPEYSQWLRIVAAVGDALHDDDAVEVLSQWSPEEKPGEYLEKLHSGLEKVRIGTLIHLAKANGWMDEAPKADSINYSAAILSACDLNAMDIPKRPALLGSWMREGDIGFVFAARGIGKTWLSLLTGNAVAEGAKLGEWEAGESPRTVLYVDGEMSLADSQFRARAIGITAPHFRWLHHEHLYAEQEQTLNIAAANCQTAISALLDAGSVLILDNLSALCRGIAENDNDAWEAILPWLLSLRRRKVTVIIVHHAGRNGEMRGASRREDAADWILRLRDDTEDDDTREKAIITHFTKCRGCSPKDAPPLRWTLHIGEQITYTCKLHSGPDALAALVSGGVTEPSECADMLSVARGTVSKWAKKLQTEGRICIKARKYLPPETEPQGSG